MNLGAYAKAIMAFVAGAATPLAAAAAHSGTLTTTDLLTALATAVVSGGTVLGVKNTKAKTVSDLVVTVVADLDKFKAALDTALAASLVIGSPPLAEAPNPPPAVAVGSPPTPPPAG